MRDDTKYLVAEIRISVTQSSYHYCNKTHHQEHLKLKWSRDFGLQLVSRGAPRDSNSEKILPNEFCAEIRTTDKVKELK